MKKRIFSGLAKSGFTLVEVILVTAILSIISLTVYGVFSNGMKIWQRIVRASSVEDVNIFFEKISYDLRNTLLMENLSFVGEKNKVVIPTLLLGSDKLSLGFAIYDYDDQAATLSRIEKDYSQIHQDDPGYKRVLVENVNFFELEYYYYYPQRDEYVWSSFWAEEEGFEKITPEERFPLAVRIKISVKDRNFIKNFKRTISIPIAYCTPRTLIVN